MRRPSRCFRVPQLQAKRTGIRPASFAILESAIQPEVSLLLTPAALNPMTTPPLPNSSTLSRDRMWQKDEDLRVESAVHGERFIEEVGFANTLTDACSGEW